MPELYNITNKKSGVRCLVSSFSQFQAQVLCARSTGDDSFRKLENVLIERVGMCRQELVHQVTNPDSGAARAKKEYRTRDRHPRLDP